MVSLIPNSFADSLSENQISTLVSAKRSCILSSTVKILSLNNSGNLTFVPNGKKLDATIPS